MNHSVILASMVTGPATVAGHGFTFPRLTRSMSYYLGSSLTVAIAVLDPFQCQPRHNAVRAMRTIHDVNMDPSV
jgi:hypothetical protein